VFDMRRREFITLLGGATAWPIAARAQQPAMPVIGFLRSTTLADAPHYVTAFRQGLKEAAFIEGQNVAIEYRWAEGRLDRLPALVADLVRQRVALIIGNTPSALAAKAATTTVPIVFVTGGDPVIDGFVASLSRPGGNITGVSFLSAAIVTKRLELLRQLLPKAAAIAVLVNLTFPQAERSEELWRPRRTRSDRNSSLSKPTAIATSRPPLQRSPRVGLVRCLSVRAGSCSRVGIGLLR
jgi:putative tryptophan/tyrosine transport system substrate-binding protein